MSLRSKTFFGFTVVSAIVVIPWVHYVQKQQRDVLHEGPAKDAKRRLQKSKKLTPEQQLRAEEYEEQKRLRAELSKDQDVAPAGSNQ